MDESLIECLQRLGLATDHLIVAKELAFDSGDQLLEAAVENLRKLTDKISAKVSSNLLKQSGTKE